MSTYSRPIVPEIYDLLRSQTALIVHFSGTPKGGGSSYELLYPDDLRKVSQGFCQGGLSCSTIMPHDEFTDLKHANATGCIGVILGLDCGQSILDAHPQDCGTYVEDGVRIVPNARNLDIADLEATICKRSPTSYNEWVIRDYVVLGIFAASPFKVWGEQMLPEPPDMPDYLRASEPVGDFIEISIRKIASDFPDRQIYSFVDNHLVMLCNDRWAPTEHNVLYRS